MKRYSFIASFIGCVFLTGTILGQSDVSGLTGHVRVSTYYLGWDNTGTSGPLDIRNDFPDAINFYTNGTATPDATIVGGNVGIGTTSVSSRLTVLGNIEIQDLNDGLHINGQVVFTCRNQTSSLYIGTQSGPAVLSGAGANTFVGSGTGLNNTTGEANTYIGNGAALWNADGDQNVAVGLLAFSNGLTGRDNVAVGAFAGLNTEGDGNVNFSAVVGV